MIAQLQRPTTTSTLQVRALATVIRRATGEELQADVMADSDGYADVTRAIRQQFGYEWEIFESWIPTAA
jgi:hypothetical protein